QSVLGTAGTGNWQEITFSDRLKKENLASSSVRFSLYLEYALENFSGFDEKPQKSPSDVFDFTKEFWSGRPGSNRRRPAWEAGILPLNYARSTATVVNEFIWNRKEVVNYLQRSKRSSRSNGSNRGLHPGSSSGTGSCPSPEPGEGTEAKSEMSK